MLKKILSVMLCMAMLIVPFGGSFALTASAAGPVVAFSINPYATITPQTTVTVSYMPSSGTSLSSCVTRLEGTSLGTGTSVSFTPAARNMPDGMYTLIGEATDNLGNKVYSPLTFYVSSSADLDYTVSNGKVSSSSSVTMYQADALDFSASYGNATDGKIDLSALNAYDAASVYNMQYAKGAVAASSVSGIPYQVFNIDLAGKTSGKVAVSYSGSTLDGERIAVKVYNPSKKTWDTVGSFMGTGSVSELVDIATYKTNGVIRVAAMLDYATNGSNMMLWSTDPQHYTKFADLNEYYYKIYQYAAKKYTAGEAGYIFTTGDLVDDRPTAAVAPAQWKVADKAMSYVEAVNMPNGLVSGNHDVCDFKNPDYTQGANTAADYSLFWKTFPASRYNQNNWYGGSINNNTSHYDLVTIGNVDFIIVHLGYGLEATDETIAWANKALQTYSHRTAFIVTHQYLLAQTAKRDVTGRGQLIYDKIVDPNPNVKAVFCGHDDGSLCLEKTASDGRTVYEILADYQFVEAEDPDFYANEHYIGTVPECCGDGYIRELTVEGDTLSSITYSPVTDRYNPYGDQEKITLDLNVNAPARQLSTSNFSAAVLGNATTATNVDRMGVVSNGTTNTYTSLLYATVPSAPSGSVASGVAATPSNPYIAQAATEIPTVSQKKDLLPVLGMSNGSTVGWWTACGNYSENPLNFVVDLTKTPYLYYSITQPANSNFTFSFISDMSTAPFLTFRDATKSGATFSTGYDAWNSYASDEQYVTTSETGCIDMRQYLTSASATTWEIEQVTFYNTLYQAVSVDYMFFGSADGTVSAGSSANNTPNDLAALKKLITRANAIDKTAYQSAGTTELTNAISQANSALTSNTVTVQAAYKRLANAIGNLRKVVTTINASTLASVKNYPMTVSSYNVNAILQSTQNANGFSLHIPTDQTNPWAAATTWSSYTVKPEGGKIYLNIDVSSESNWAIQMGITQNGVQKLVSMNVGIENSFYKADGISYEGSYKGVYEVSEALLINGFDPTATFTVNYTHLFCMGIGGRITYNHVELMTNASDGVTDKTALNAAIARAGQYTQGLYTSASWSTMQTALTDAKSALSSTSLAEADLNLKAYVLNNAIDALVYAGSYPELNGSLLPEDAAAWKANTTGAITATRTNGVTKIQNTNGQYPCMDYILDEPMRVFVNETRLLADVTVGSSANILLLVDGEWVSLTPYLSSASGDLPAGTYTVGTKLSDIAEFKGKTSINIERVRVFSVGAAASSAVTLRTLRITKFVDYPWDPDLTTYGVAATPTNTYYQHCAPYAPEVANKVDILAALGSNGPMAITGWANTAVNMTIDLNKTPYLYYSIAIPEGGNANFGLFNNTTYSPYFLFRDGTKAGPGINTGVGTWDSYSNNAQYLKASETGCLDMRKLTNTGTETTWILTNLAVYNTSGKEATMSYLFFGSEPIYVETDVNVGGGDEPTEPDEPIEPDEPALDLGDVNNDGNVNSADVRMILAEITQASNTFTDAQLDAGDYNGDGRMDSTDVRLMLDNIINSL